MPDFPWEAAAKKALGNGGKLPKPRVDPRTAIAATNKSVESFKKGRIDLEKQILDLENKFSQLKNTYQQYSDLVDGDDFGLDENKPDDKKKITAAREVMTKGLEGEMKYADSILTMLSNLDKIVTNLHRLDQACK